VSLRGGRKADEAIPSGQGKLNSSGLLRRFAPRNDTLQTGVAFVSPCPPVRLWRKGEKQRGKEKIPSTFCSHPAIDRKGKRIYPTVAHSKACYI